MKNIINLKKLFLFSITFVFLMLILKCIRGNEGTSNQNSEKSDYPIFNNKSNKTKLNSGKYLNIKDKVQPANKTKTNTDNSKINDEKQNKDNSLETLNLSLDNKNKLKTITTKKLEQTEDFDKNKPFVYLLDPFRSDKYYLLNISKNETLLSFK